MRCKQFLASVLSIWAVGAVSVSASPALAAGEIQLFDGDDLAGWSTLDGRAPRWRLEGGAMEILPGSGDLRTVDTFRDFELHAEFWIPSLPDLDGQNRGNSGIYLLGRYEIQILDSFQNDTYGNGACGALYGQIAPSSNASLPPETWQTYDIKFRAPRVQGGTVVEDGRLTIVHNGVTVIDDARVSRVTGGALDDRQGEPGPIRIQDHGHRLRFRNIWIRPLS